MSPIGSTSPAPDPTGKREADLLEALMMMRRDIDPFVDADDSQQERTPEDQLRRSYYRAIPPSLIGLIRLAGLVSRVVHERAAVARTEFHQPGVVSGHEGPAVQRDRDQRRSSQTPRGSRHLAPGDPGSDGGHRQLLRRTVHQLV